MVKFYYPKKNQFSTQSLFAPTKQTALNGFPRYSISIFDDPNFQYKRQSIKGKQVVSNIISDDYYAFSSSDEDRVNYVSGINAQNEIYYIKILVHKQVVEDTVGEMSSVLVLSKTQTLGKSSTVYYGVTCIEKNQLYTSYTAAISIPNSDFINQSDGEAFFTLLGDYSVSYSFPLNLAITNASPTTIPQVSSVTPAIATFQDNYSQYFKTTSMTFELFEYSNSFEYNFTSLDLSLSTILFNTTSSGSFTTGSTGTLIRLTASDMEFSKKYFGVTISNTDATYAPSRDTYFFLMIRTTSGNLIKIEPCKILNNSTSGFFNVIFNFKDIPDGIDYLNLDYVLLEVKTRTTSAIITPYTISYMYFMETADSSFNLFSLKYAPEGFCYSPLGDTFMLSELKKKTEIKTSDYFGTVESLIIVSEEIVYELSTESETIRLPENSMIKTEDGFLPVYSLDKSTAVICHDILTSIKSLKILPPLDCTLIDTYEDSDYSYNGFYVKNPLFMKNFKKQFLETLNNLNITQPVIIDDVEILADLEGIYYAVSSFILDAFTVHTIIFNSLSTKAIIFYNCQSDLTVKFNNNATVLKNKKSYVFNLENNHIVELKSNSNIEVVKIIIK